MNTNPIPITIIPRRAALVVPAARAEIAARDARRARLARGRPRRDARQGRSEARHAILGDADDGSHVEGAGAAYAPRHGLPVGWQARWAAERAGKVARGECRAGVGALMRVRELFGEGVGRG